MKARWTPVLLLAVLALAGCGRAVDATLPVDDTFARQDANGDGRLTFAESGLDAETFARYDTDGDARLSAFEWQGAQTDPTLPGRLQAQNENTRPFRPTGPGTW